MKPRHPRNTVSSTRKSVHGLGLALSILGAVTVVVSFLGFASAGMASVRSHGDSGDPFGWFIGFVVGGILAAIGQSMRHTAARGVAGSGLVLDPERARDDLEPWARAGGGLLRDAIDEAGLGRPTGEPRNDEPLVKVRCRECSTLNDEDARFCDACGAKL